MEKARTLGGLVQSGYKVLSVKEEIRANLIKKMKKGERLFPGLIGYDHTVIPQMENALLAGHDFIVLGERGQGKSRLIRSLKELLDEEVPAVAGCEINDNPFNPICRQCKERLAKEGDGLEICWIDPDARFLEKIATPDVTIMDLIGDIDPVKLAEGRYLSSEGVIHWGLIPRLHRGIFCISELPDLGERIQVSLFSVLEERTLQVKGFKLSLPLDLLVVASVNPEDYTNRGRIVTPLKDRFRSQIRTHYPRTWEDEIRIMEQEASLLEPDELGLDIEVPLFIKEVVAELTRLARAHPEIDQHSGVSVRVTISNYEALVASAVRRSIRLKEKEAVPRITDLYNIQHAMRGKFELMSIEEKDEETLIGQLSATAIKRVFDHHFPLDALNGLVEKFKDGLAVETSEFFPSEAYQQILEELPEAKDPIEKLALPFRPGTLAAGIEFILEGLYLSNRLSKVETFGKALYQKGLALKEGRPGWSPLSP